MYLRGLSRLGDQAQQRADCIAAGGYFDPIPADAAGYPATGNCFYPPGGRGASSPAASMPITITVPTNVQTTTQVNPQISPQFVQQQQPTNSPVGLTANQAPSSQAPVNIPDSFVPATPAAASVDSGTQSLVDFFKSLAASSPASQTSPIYTASPGPQYAPSSSYAPPIIIDPSSGLPTPAPAAAPTLLDQLKNYAPLIIAATAVLGYLATRKHKGR